MPSERAVAVRIGTSGWEYRHWRGVFYPHDLPQSRWLEHYAATFDTVELNNSFYRLPDTDTFAGWARRVPPSFVMAVKASRYLTHVKRLRDPQEPLERFWSRVVHLGRRVGPVLYQLPPRWRRNEERLRAFLAAVPRGRLQALEFRDPSWYTPSVEALLAEHDIALVLHDMPGSARQDRPVGSLVYIRFHGAGERYGGAYPRRDLDAWAERLAAWAAEGRPAYAYFNNDVGGHAVRDALYLRDAVSRQAVA